MMSLKSTANKNNNNKIASPYQTVISLYINVLYVNLVNLMFNLATQICRQDIMCLFLGNYIIFTSGIIPM